MPILPIDHALDVTFTSVDKDTLVLSGNNWSFSTVAIWRCIKDNNITCTTFNNKLLDKDINGKRIIEIYIEENTKDLTLHFNDGHIIEVFVVDSYEPWILNTPDTVYVS